MESNIVELTDLNEASKSDQCKVCGHPAHGIHFGVLTCRACAAFFRRSIVLSKKYWCRKASGECIISIEDRFLCRLCRFNKCKSLGMTDDNVRWNRDVVRSEELATEQESKVGPISSLIPGSKCFAPPSQPLFDISGTMDKISRILENFEPSSADPGYSDRNTLQKMNWALQNHRKKQKLSTMKIRLSIDLEKIVGTWSSEMIRIAKWMMHSDVFRGLTKDTKFSMFRNAWMIWYRFERISITTELFGKRAETEKLLIVTHTDALRMDQSEIDMTLITDYSADQLRKMFAPFCTKIIEDITKPLVKIKPTSIEVTYMLCHIFWYVAGKSLQGDVLVASEKFLEDIANNLHDYYTKEIRMPTYSLRLIKLMSVLNSLQKVNSEREKIVDLAKLFDVFKTPIVNPSVSPL